MMDTAKKNCSRTANSKTHAGFTTINNQVANYAYILDFFIINADFSIKNCF